jgi:Rad3-related DNA helicase
MITERDLREAIAECKGERHPTARTCIQLAAFYILQDHLFEEPTSDDRQMTVRHSYSAGPKAEEMESDFMRAIRRLDEDEAWRLVQELVEALAILNPNLYHNFMNKIGA